MLTSDAGRARFWAASAVAHDGQIRFQFANGQECVSEILEMTPPSVFRLTYFNGSIVTFTLDSNDRGGTTLLLTEENVAANEWLDNFAGWVSVLLNLKAAADFGVDLRNDHPSCTWDAGFVDV